MHPRIHRFALRPLPILLLLLNVLAGAAPRAADAFTRVSPNPRTAVRGDTVDVFVSDFDPGVTLTVTLDGTVSVPITVTDSGRGRARLAIPPTFEVGTFELRACEACTGDYESQFALGRLTVVSGALTGTELDYQIRGIEVTQGVRLDIPTRSLLPGSGPTLPAETAVHVANRRTVVRVYPELDRGLNTPPPLGLVATLIVRDGPTVVWTDTRSLGFGPRKTLQERRSASGHSFNFTLPPEVVALPAGTPSRSLDMEASLTAASEDPGYTGNNTAFLNDVEFRHVQGINTGSYTAALRLRPHFVTRRFELAPGDTTTLTADPLVMLPLAVSNFQQVMPLPDTRQGIRFFGFRTATYVGETDSSGVNLFTQWALDLLVPGKSVWGHPDNSYFGMLFAEAICAGIGWVGSGYFQSYVCPSPDYTVSHEITHAIGSPHAGNGHDEDDGGGFNPSYPGVHGQVEPNAYGFNVYTGVAIGPWSGVGPEYVRHDLMSYGFDRFISAYTWNKIADDLESGSVGVSSPGGPPPLAAPAPVPQAGPMDEEGDWRGFIGHLDTGTLELQATPLFTTTPPPLFSGAGAEYLVRFFDSNALQIGSSPVFGGPVQDNLEGDPKVLVNSPVDVPAGWVSMSFGTTTETWESFVRSANPPTVTLLSPSPGFFWGNTGTATVSWSGNDTDGDPLVYRVWGILDGAERFVLAGNISGNQTVLDLSELPRGGNWQVFVEASDGFDSGFSATASGTAAYHDPLVAIVHPADGTVHPADVPLLANAAFADKQMTEQEYDEAEVTWTLNAAPADTGDAVSFGELAPGTYTLEASVTGPLGNVAFHSVTVDVVADLPTPVLASPADGATAVPQLVLLGWNEAPGGLSYAVEVATDAAFQDPAASASPVYDTGLAVELGPGRTYYWRVATEGAGTRSPWSAVRSFTTAVPVGLPEDEPAKPGLALRVQPNPMTAGTRVVFRVGEPTQASVRVYDATGALVRRVFEGHLGPGAYAMPWDGTNTRGVRAARGVYLVRVEADGRTETARAVLLR